MQEKANTCMGCLAGCGVALLVIVVVVLALLNVVVAGAQGDGDAGASCEGGAWFESETTGRIWLVNFEETLGCRWGTPDDMDALQRTGRCGWDAVFNRFAVLTHNWKCDAWTCPVGKGWVSNIPLLDVGDRADLCEFGALWRGRVVEVVDSDGSVQPQDDFRCGGDACGTIVTSVGDRLSEWGPTGRFVVVRLRYTRAAP